MKHFHPPKPKPKPKPNPNPNPMIHPDVESLQPLDPLLANITTSIAPTTKPKPRNPTVMAAHPLRSAPPQRPTSIAAVALLSNDLPFTHNAPNALLISAPGHPLWLQVLRAVQAAAAARCADDWVEEVGGWVGGWVGSSPLITVLHTVRRCAWVAADVVTWWFVGFLLLLMSCC